MKKVQLGGAEETTQGNTVVGTLVIETADRHGEDGARQDLAGCQTLRPLHVSPVMFGLGMLYRLVYPSAARLSDEMMRWCVGRDHMISMNNYLKSS